MNALCNLSRKKSREVTASLPGRFLSRHCFTLCVTMEVELRIAQITGERGKKGGEKVSFRRFLADQNIAIL